MSDSYKDYYTFNDEDAILMKKNEYERLAKYSDLAKKIVHNSSLCAEEIFQIKKYGIVKLENFFDRKYILKLGKDLERNINQSLPGLKVRNHKEELEIASNTLERKHIELPSDATIYHARKVTSGIILQDHFLKMPEFLDLFSNKKLQSIVTGFYESIPIVTFAKARMALASDWNNGGTDTQRWHSDVGSFRILKALIYLNDVSIDGGPFQYIKESHVNSADEMIDDLRYEDKELKKKYKKGQFLSCTAKAGDVIFCDTAGIHRGMPIVSDDRRIIIVTFCMHRENTPVPYDLVKVKKSDLNKRDRIVQALFDDAQII